MVRLGDADLRVGAAAQLAAAHERDDARQIGSGTPAPAGRTSASRARRTSPECRPAARSTGSSLVALLLGLLDAPLDVADRVEILGELGAVARRRGRRCRRATFSRHRVEDAAVVADARAAAPPDRCCRCRRTAARTPRAGCSPSAAASSGCARRSCWCRRSCSRCRTSRRSRAPRGASSSDASCVPGRARWPRIWSHRDAGRDLGPLRRASGGDTPVRKRVHARRRAAPPVESRRLAVQAASARAADRGTAPAACSIGVNSNAGAFGLRRPVRASPCRSARRRRRSGRTGSRGRLPTRRQRRDHAVEQRQREGRAEAAQDRPPRDGLSW